MEFNEPAGRRLLEIILQWYPQVRPGNRIPDDGVLGICFPCCTSDLNRRLLDVRAGLDYALDQGWIKEAYNGVHLVLTWSGFSEAKKRIHLLECTNPLVSQRSMLRRR
jgi:hypothetical protein